MGLGAQVGGDNGVWAPGFTAGVGAEWKLTDHWSLRGEYRYFHFDFSRGDSREQQFDVPGASGFNHALFNTNTYQTSVFISPSSASPTGSDL